MTKVILNRKIVISQAVSSLCENGHFFLLNYMSHCVLSNPKLQYKKNIRGPYNKYDQWEGEGSPFNNIAKSIRSTISGAMQNGFRPIFNTLCIIANS